MKKIRIFVELAPFDKNPIICARKEEAEQVSVKTGGTAWIVETVYLKSGLSFISHLRYSKKEKKWFNE